MATGKLYENGVGWRDFAATDIPASGVTAGSYGDGTHVGAFTVAANGTITAASSVAITGGGAAAGLVVLYDSGYLGADASSIDTGAGGIASGHFALMIFGYLRATAANTSDNVLLTFNNDSSALYDVNRIQNANTTVTGASVSLGTSANVANAPGANAPANTFGAFLMNVPAYDGTANFKSGEVSGGATQSTVGNNNQNRQTFVYQSTAAISRLAIVTGTGGAKWLAGSRLVIYGTQ